jgi:hypothetical protein
MQQFLQASRRVLQADNLPARYLAAWAYMLLLHEHPFV